jgi:hypothetical protein
MELVDGVNLRQAMKAGRSAKIASRVGLRGQGMASGARVNAQTYSTSDYCKQQYKRGGSSRFESQNLVFEGAKSALEGTGRRLVSRLPEETPDDEFNHPA